MAHPLLMELSSDLATGLIVLNRALMLTVSLFCFGVVDAGVYKWIDKEGRIQYSDAPPVEIKATEVQTRISTIKGPPVVSKLERPATSSPAKAAGVRIFTTPWCGYCKKAKAFLQARGTPYEELDVEASAHAQAEYKSIGGHGVPVILVGEQRMDGYGEERLAFMLKSAGL